MFWIMFFLFLIVALICFFLNKLLKRKRLIQIQQAENQRIESKTINVFIDISESFYEIKLKTKKIKEFLRKGFYPHIRLVPYKMLTSDDWFQKLLYIGLHIRCKNDYIQIKQYIKVSTCIFNHQNIIDLESGKSDENVLFLDHMCKFLKLLIMAFNELEHDFMCYEDDINFIFKCFHNKQSIIKVINEQ